MNHKLLIFLHNLMINIVSISLRKNKRESSASIVKISCQHKKNMRKRYLIIEITDVINILCGIYKIWHFYRQKIKWSFMSVQMAVNQYMHAYRNRKKFLINEYHVIYFSFFIKRFQSSKPCVFKHFSIIILSLLISFFKNN